MIRVHLNEEQVQRLEQAYLQATDVAYRDRLQTVRLAHRGRKHQDIAADLGVTPRTVQNRLNAYLRGGLDGLRPREAKGAEPKIPAAPAAEVRRWVIAGPAGQGLDRANWTHAELADHLYRSHGLRASRSAMQRFCSRQGIRSYRPTYEFLRGDPVRQAQAREEMADFKEAAGRGELVSLSQDEARFPMVPTLSATLGVKGFRPTVGTRDCKDLLYVFAAVDTVTGGLHTNTVESPARAKRTTGKSKTRRLQEAFAAHLRHLAARYPVGLHKRVVPAIDNAPWHRGKPIDETLKEHSHLELYRLPSYSPQLNVIERFWKLLRRRATHDRLFDTLKDLRRSIRSSLCYFQTVTGRVRRLIQGCYARPENQNASAGS
jgi:transposase